MKPKKSTCNDNDLAMKYFSEHPAQEWSFEGFENAFNENKSTKANQKTVKSIFLNALKSLKNKSSISENTKSRIIQLIDLDKKKPSSVTLNLSTGESSTINNNFGDGIINFNQTQQPQQNASDDRDSDDRDSDERDSDKDDSDEDDSDEDATKFPSDLSIDHHPRRTSDYTLLFEGSSYQSEGSADNCRWMLDDTCISDLCLNVKSTTIQMVNDINPAQLSDIRLLAVNDIYLFDKNYASSISKYFSLGVHNALKPSLLFEKYHPENGNRCFDWCIGIEVSPPHNWLSSLTLCAKMLSDACESENVLDLHTAHVLAFILPIFVNGQPDCSIEDSFVHNYISPLLSSVFSSDPLLNMKWANGKLANDSNASYKPDFQVFNLSGSVKCIVLIAEFKHSEQNSYVESDLLKLGKQMRLTLNKLISDGINNPKVCGVHCEGLNLNTYVMDLISPKVYRMINVAKVKLFVNLDQISLLPRVLAHLICLKNIALETSQKIENVIVSGCATLKRPAPSPPLSWLSNDSYVLSRVAKKQKK